MATVDTFLADLRGYIQHQDEKPLLGPSFYQGLLAGELSRPQLKKWGAQPLLCHRPAYPGLWWGFL